METPVVNRYRPLPLEPIGGISNFSHGTLWRSPQSISTAPSAFWQLMLTLWRAKRSIILAALFGGLLTGLLGLSRPVPYEAKAQLITSSPNSAAGSGAAIVSQESINETIDSHLTRLVSQAQLRRTIALLETQGETATLASLRKKGENLGTIATLTRTLRAGTDQLQHLLQFGEVASADNTPVDANAALIEALRRGLRVGQELRSRVISVGFTDTNRATAAIVTNAVVQAYVGQLTIQSRASYQRELASIIERIPAMQNELALAIKKKETFSIDTGAGSAIDLGASNEEVAQLKHLLSVAQTNLAAATSQGPEANTELQLPAGLRPPAQTSEQQELFQPGREKQYFEQQIAALEWRINKAEVAKNNAADRLSGLRALELEIDAESSQYKDVLAKRETLRQHANSPFVGVSVLSSAWAQAEPKTLSPLFLIPPGGILFGLLASMFAVLRSSLNDKVNTEADSEEAMGIASAGQLPEQRGLTAGTLSDMILKQPNSNYRHAISSILVGLAPLNANAKSSKLVVVTSGLEDDGKTELAWGLALAAKRFGHRALFINLDTEMTPESQLFWGDLDTGPVAINFFDFVDRKCALQDVIVMLPDTGIAYTVAPADCADRLAALSYSGLQHCVDRLRQDFSMVIVNGPTGVAAPEMRLLAAQADTILIAVRQGKTKRSVARAALKFFTQDKAHSRAISSVLTGASLNG